MVRILTPFVLLVSLLSSTSTVTSLNCPTYYTPLCCGRADATSRNLMVGPAGIQKKTPLSEGNARGFYCSLGVDCETPQCCGSFWENTGQKEILSVECLTTDWNHAEI
ncbi:hypothetical protein VTL71DRAFT_9287 [Oculimacula yallundae]|uniref:Uncharacterized protein n=1 Tax=Oculimacula yallundae TaxID=86028 RepID=A0ABR4BU65_9HELO